MAVAVVQEWLEAETDRSTTNYDAIHQRLMQSGPIEGFLLHTAGFIRLPQLMGTWIGCDRAWLLGFGDFVQLVRVCPRRVRRLGLRRAVAR